MRAGDTLQPDQRIAHYRVVGPLGAGGMGEVYLAQDLTLGRNVALKILPPELTRSEERVARFVQEARSASSLNHPNIVTIHEIGEDRVSPARGEPDPQSGPLKYIAMELVNGRTLAERIHDGRTDLRTLLGWLAQAAEGVAKAHASGVVHRDLKPGNIMVTEDGFAKVLDFGLAKLVESPAGDSAETSAPTATGPPTSEGAVLGTVGYMSPEQVQGRPVDRSADVFAFGCILYEAATRRAPFAAETRVETLHRILHDTPTPIDEIAPGVPAELRRLIRRCLAKNPDQRVQSMKDVALELREIVDEYDALSASASSGSGTSGVSSAAAGRRAPLAPILIGAAVVTLAALALAWYGWRRAAREEALPFRDATLVAQTSSGDVADVALSRDGRYLAYVTQSVGRSSLHVRQVATGSDVVIVPPGDALLRSPCFSPDGDYVLFRSSQPSKPGFSLLLQAPSLGGSAEQRAADVDSRVTFAPDGHRIAFLRGDQHAATTAIVIRDLESGRERVLASYPATFQLPSGPDWSPDGRSIAVVIQAAPPRESSTIALFDPESGRRRDLYEKRQMGIQELAWLRDGSGLVLAAFDASLGQGQQLLLLPSSGGTPRRITNDVYEYVSVSTCGGAAALAAVRRTYLGNFWLVDAGSGDVTQLTSATNDETSPYGPAVAEDGTIYYVAFHDQDVALWSIPSGGGSPRLVHTDHGWINRVHCAAGRVVFGRYDYRDGSQHIWSVAADGGDARQLTSGAGEHLQGTSVAGGFATFTRVDSARGVWAVPLSGGPPRQLSEGAAPRIADPSPDGRWVATMRYTAELSNPVREIVPASGDGPRVTVRLPAAARSPAWGADSRSCEYIDAADSCWNLARLPQDGGTPERLTRFTTGRVTQFARSPDGSRIAVVRRIGPQSSLWLTDAGGAGATEVKGLSPERFFVLAWSPDSRHLVVDAGSMIEDAVLARAGR